MDFQENYPKNLHKNADFLKPCTDRVSHSFCNLKSGNSNKSEPCYFLNIFKPCGMTSFDVIHKLRKRLKIKKIGHSGTLDPMAEGVMQVGVGKATRLLDYLDSDKKYVAKIRFGYFSSTGDAEGDIAFFNIPKFSYDELLAALNSLNGEIEQIPPAYSAVKIGGKKLCDLARKNDKNLKSAKNGVFEIGLNPKQSLDAIEFVPDKEMLNSIYTLNTGLSKEENSSSAKDLDVLIKNLNNELIGIEIPKRSVQIYETKLLNFVTIQSPENPDIEIPYEADIEVFCSKGTYIRTFAVDLAGKLGTSAYLTSLKRTLAGNFQLKDSLEIDEIEPERDSINPCSVLNLPSYELNAEEYNKVLNGVGFVAQDFSLQNVVKKLHKLNEPQKTLSNQCFMLIFQNNIVSIAVLSDNKFVCKKVFK